MIRGPYRPNGLKRGTVIGARVDETERLAITAAAERAGQSLSDFARSAMLDLVKRSAGQPPTIIKAAATGKAFV